MRNRIGFIEHRVALQQRRGAGTQIVLNWTEVSGTVTTNGVTGAVTGTSHTAKQETVWGFFHEVQIAQSEVRQFNEVETGDAIIDFAGDVEIDGRVGLTLTINGSKWAPKKLSDRLGQTWDVTVQGRRLVRSVLVRKAT